MDSQRVAWITETQAPWILTITKGRESVHSDFTCLGPGVLMCGLGKYEPWHTCFASPLAASTCLPALARLPKEGWWIWINNFKYPEHQPSERSELRTTGACIQHMPLIPSYLPVSAVCQQREVLSLHSLVSPTSSVLGNVSFPNKPGQLACSQTPWQRFWSGKDKMQMVSGGPVNSLLVKRLVTPAVGRPHPRRVT